MSSKSVKNLISYFVSFHYNRITYKRLTDNTTTTNSLKASMPRGQKTKLSGGYRRNIRMPCGKVFQGHPDRLRGAISAHQKVCCKCACKDCSFAWKEALSQTPNHSDLHGSNSGATNNIHNKQTITAISSTGDRVSTTIPKVGGVADTLASVSNQQLQDAARSKKKTKGKKRKSKVQSGWAESEQTDTDQVSILIPLDGDLDEKHTRLLQSLTDDLTMDEILEKLTSSGIQFATLTD